MCSKTTLPIYIRKTKFPLKLIKKLKNLVKLVLNYIEVEWLPKNNK